MSATTSMFMEAQLSEAAYADLTDATGHVLSGDALKSALKAEGMSDTQATDFITHWEVVHHLPNTDSGFSGTLFRRVDTDPEH